VHARFNGRLKLYSSRFVRVASSSFVRVASSRFVRVTMPRLGSAIIRYETVSSTNDVARELALNDAPEGTVVLALRQTSGRGRQGRSWSSPAGEGLYLSAILRPSISPADSAIITLVAAVAVAEMLTVDFNTQA